MFNQVTYNVLIERFKAFATGHYKIERFSHGQIDVTDIDKDQRFPWMHVVPVSIAPSSGSRSFTLDIVFADMPRDKEEKTEYQRESLSDCIQIAEDLLAEIKNGGVIFGEDVTLEEGSAVQPFMEEYTHVLTGVTLSLTMTFPWNWNACDIPADWTTGGSSSGGGGGVVPALVLKVNNVDNINQQILNFTNGTNVTIEDLGDGRVRINSSGGITSVAWGDIIGNIADQLDLAIWFNEKADITSLAEVAFTGDFNDLNDVDTTGQIFKNVLYFNGTQWIPYMLAAVAYSGSYADLSNQPVIPKTIADLIGNGVKIGDMIQWNGAQWVVVSLLALGELSNVDAATPTNGQFLQYNSATQKWEAVTASFVQLNADWNAISGVQEILNKPILATVATTGDYNDLDNLPTIPAAQIQSDWTQANTSALDYIKNKPTIPAVIGDMLKSVYDTDADGVVDAAERIEIIVRNSTGVTLQKGQIVYLSGATGNRPNAVLADASTEATSSKTIGFVVANIANNSDGNVAVNGTLHDLDTSAFSAGDTLWLSETAGAWQANTPPAKPAHAVFLGYVARSHPNVGRVVIQVQNGYELNELHNVDVPSPQPNDYLYYDSGTSLWKSRQLALGSITDVTTVGFNIGTLTPPSAISYLRINADNSISTLSLAQLKVELGLSRTVLASAVSTSAVSTALFDVTGLTFPIVAGNTYKFTAYLVHTVSVNNVGLKWAVNANVAVTNIVYRTIQNSGVPSAIFVHQANTLNSASTNTSATASNLINTIEGILVANNTGTAIIRFGKANANAGTLTVQAGSFVEYEII